jgi:hypothetical protein
MMRWPQRRTLRPTRRSRPIRLTIIIRRTLNHRIRILVLLQPHCLFLTQTRPWTPRKSRQTPPRLRHRRIRQPSVRLVKRGQLRGRQLWRGRHIPGLHQPNWPWSPGTRTPSMVICRGSTFPALRVRVRDSIEGIRADSKLVSLRGQQPLDIPSIARCDAAGAGRLCVARRRGLRGEQ